MKIAVIGAKVMPPEQGGIEHVCAELYPRVVHAGHSVDLYTRASLRKHHQHSHYFQGVRVMPLSGITSRGLHAVSTSFLGALSASRGNYDVVHFHAIGPSLFSLLVRAIAPKSKVVVTCHGLDWQRDKWGTVARKYLQLSEKVAVRFADEIIVVSKDLQTYFWENYRKKTTYIPNAAAGYAASDPQMSFCSQLGLSKDRYIVFLGRLVPEKCPDLLIRAFQTLRPAGWKLAIVGKASDTSQYAAHLRQLASGNPAVVFTDELRGSQLAEVMRGAGLFVLPSRLEGMPLALLEAMSEKIPVLASDILPHQNLVGNEQGLLFRTDDLASCVHRLDWALQHPKEMTAFARNAHQFIQDNHTWEIVTAQTLEVYKSLIAPSLNVSYRPARETVDSGATR